MRRHFARTSLAIAVIAIAGGCSHRRQEPAPPATTPVAAAAEATVPSGRVHGLRKLLNVDVPVFVDGAQVAVLRYGELPPQMQPTTLPSNSHHALRYWRVSDYLRGIGVDVARVKAVHFADKSDRIAALEGQELRSDEDRFVFDFTATTAGMPEMAWKTVGLKTMLRVDYFHALNVFVTKTPWEIDRRHHCYLEADGECRPVARFADGDLVKGTRVYVDGKLVASVKRRAISDAAVAAAKSDDEVVVSTDAYLASIGVDTRDAKRVELVSGDSVVASATAAQWAANRDRLTFRVVRHAHGKVRASVPADLQARGTVDREATITAIEVFRRTEPRDAPIVALDNLVDPSAPDAVAQVATDEAPQD